MKITITRAEGPTHLCRRYEFSTLEAATAHLMAYRSTYPEQGYHKHGVEVIHNGKAYRRRLDCDAGGTDCNVREVFMNSGIRFNPTWANVACAAMGGNGQVFTALDGRHLREVCSDLGARRLTRYGDTMIYVFDDNSAIVDTGGHWGIRVEDCENDCIDVCRCSSPVPS